MNRGIFLICMQQTNHTLHSNGSPPPSLKIKQMRYPHRSHSFHLPTQTITNSPSLPLNSHPNSQSQTLILDLAKALATQLDSCTDPKLRAQIHTRLLRFSLLHSPFHWNSLMRCYLRHGHPGPTLALFTQMRRRGAHPDPYTLPLALKAACHVYSSPLGRQLHCLALKHGLARHRFTESGIISLYSKSGLFGCARKVFDENPERGVGSWNAMVNGLAQAGRAVEAIGLFVEMRASGLVPDEVTMVSVVSACGGLGDVGLAEQVHKLALQVKSLERVDIVLSNSLVDMYCKCGLTDLAYRVFSKMPQRNVSTWTAMIAGLGTHGQEKLALEFFEKMRQEGVQPNHVTMVAVLNSCAHGGLVEEGMEFLDKMKEVYEVEPRAVHYGCVIDMLGRVGRMKEAREVAEKMPVGQNAIVWGTLLGASEKHGDVEVGEWAAQNLMELEPWNDGVYVVLSNIYAAAGMWGEVEKLRKMMRGKRVAKVPGYSLATRDS